MKLYTCSNCGNLLYFENDICLSCSNSTGFDAAQMEMKSFTGNTEFKYCANAVHGVCNWLIPASDNSEFCTACQLNRTIPPLNNETNHALWIKMERAKHRLVFSLLRLRLHVIPKTETNHGLAFDFLVQGNEKEKIMTGHDDGLITINLEEADDAVRVKHQKDLGERYRTLLGHFRHEVGHYYWDLLVKDKPAIEQFRELFGDERKDYATALTEYYEKPASNWNEHFISTYASAHPWEDWAETWAHYMHMMDTLETAYWFGIGVNTDKLDTSQEIETDVRKDPYEISDFQKIVKTWMPLTFAINSINRSMGFADFYPFILSPAVVRKLDFIHQLCRLPQ